MPPVNDFLPFCPTDTGTNLLSESDYAAASDRTNGNQPGVASSKLVNKAVRQATYIAGQVAQYLANITGADVVDDATPAKLLSQMNAGFKYLNPVVTSYLTSGSGNHNLTYKFMIASGNATLNATYTNNGVTYTVTKTVAAGTQLNASGSGAPLVSGTLTKTSGTGDATITFYAVRAPLYIRVRGVGGGGGGAGSGTSAGSAAGNGGNTTFGTTLLVANGGTAGGANGSGAAGGSASLGTGPIGLAIAGANGGGCSPATVSLSGAGGIGGASVYGGAGSNGGSTNPTSGFPAAANSGSGGGGGGGGTTSSSFGGGGGGSGGFFDAIIPNDILLSTYAWAVGAFGTAGGIGAGAAGTSGGQGGNGCIIVEEHYQ